MTDGRMRHIAFVLDPDDYWVEVIGQKPVEETENVTETDVSTYSMVCIVPTVYMSLKFPVTLTQTPEPYHDPRQGCREVPEILPGGARNVADALPRE